ncbi:competence/damage-inducible protein A [Sulfurimonas autotrophica]|uniref:Molybdopterin binding domain protein n=1 Tax=Sulfurimonas autotrophica (strain ATCC BAA-671 / DSM 16294 / JCM 11897 / OK10) TaxID=563040 RepID=E0UT06_SULAO|nr:molybdopterin-binding protein [Sulfurimonas autotrophica]ADN09247.1 molybdopterin binding domain protein [Sulfurimonas autotrophica DSM 16294]
MPKSDMMNFYAVIIGTEILNGRRVDKHFEFLKNELAKYGHEIFGSFVIKDDTELMKRTYTMIKEDKSAVMFSFGGIGSTPDDLTREVASVVFRNSKPATHEKFKHDIIEKFGDEAFPHRIHMADLPPNAKLLHNPVNNMSGFSLDDRFFFMPGFPSMSHPMVSEIIKKYFNKSKQKYRYTLKAKTSENTLIGLMQQLPKSVELSSLPIFIDKKPNIELSLSGTNNEEVKKYFNMFQEELTHKNIPFTLT